MNKKLKISIVAMAMVFVLLVGNILAYFTDADTATNEFTTGRISIDLQEPNWDPSLGGELVPGFELAKDPQVLNDGINDAFIFVTVDVPYQNVTTTDELGNKLTPSDTELFSYDVKDDWVQVGEPIVDTENGIVRYVYAYAQDNKMTTLAPNDTTPTVFDYIRFEGVIEDEGLEELRLDVVVNAYSIQTDNLDGGKTTPEDVWQIVSNAKGSDSNTNEEDGMNEYGFYFDKPYTYINTAPKLAMTGKRTFIWHEDGRTEVYEMNRLVGEEISTYSGNEVTVMGETGIISPDGSTVTFGDQVYSLDDNFIYTEDEHYIYYDDRDASGGWGVEVKDKTLTSYNDIPSEIDGIPVTSLDYCFEDCKNMITAPKIPDGIVDMYNAFSGCASLENAPEIPNNVEDMTGTFYRCTSLKSAPIIPDSVVYMTSAFRDCTSLVNAPVIPKNVYSMASTFNGCISLTGNIEINTNSFYDHYDYQRCFKDTIKPIVITGTTTFKSGLAATANNGNVTY